MATESVEALIEGGKATAAPPLGPALGPLGVNIGQVIGEINNKTQSFKGMQVPVTVDVNTETKEFEIKVGTPPTSSLILKETNLKGGSGRPQEEFVADMLIEQVIKVAIMKEDALLGKNMKNKVKEVIGTCDSMGVKVEGVKAVEAIKLVNQGEFDKQIKERKTELSDEEKKKLEEERKQMQAELEEKHAELEETAQKIIDMMEGSDRSAIMAKLHAENIPDEIIRDLLPTEGEDEEGGETVAAPESEPTEKSE